MYASPQMGQMPRTSLNFKQRLAPYSFLAPQTYMQAPPGQYPPPPNGAGPRPSMPPTPIPAHAHPYYHQSPQRMSHDLSFPIDQFNLRHVVPQAVPYPMMMPPGPGGPPHGYDGGPAPPVPMGGGVGHA